MLVPLSWLRTYVTWGQSTEELAAVLTLAGLEVTGRERVGDWWDRETLRVGEVMAVQPHPAADRLVLVDVNDGATETEQVVTGAPNLFQYRGQDTLPCLKVAFARVGTVLVDAYAKTQPRPRKKLKQSKIRGILSRGMVCSERELGLSEEHEGIMLLPDDAPVGMPLADYLGEEILELDLTPDMARGLSMMGVAREVAALLDGTLQPPPPSPSWEMDSPPPVDVRIDTPELCPRYVAVVVQDLTVGPSPAWMQQRLLRSGMRPVNNVVDITNYVMLELGQPLHAFDYDRLRARSQAAGADLPCIGVRTAKAQETLVTLDGVQRDLNATMLLITDQAGPLAIAGVMGGAETEVNTQTRCVLIESATFDGINNRQTAQALRLHSEASHRFTHGVAPNLNLPAALRAAGLMCELAGGRIAGPVIDAYPRPQETVAICLTASEVNRQLGLEPALELPRIQAALEKLDIACQVVPAIPVNSSAQAQFGLQRRDGEAVLVCTPPWYRLDLRIPADLTEEVARVVGYNRVGLSHISDEIPGHEPNMVLATEDRIRDVLSGIGLQEAIGFSYTSAENHARLYAHVPPDPDRAQFVELANPLTQERGVMRRDLLVSALENLAYNLRYEARLAAFEIGLEFLPDAAMAPYPREVRKLQLVMTGPRHRAHFQAPATDSVFDYYDLKGVLETLFQRLDLEDRITFSAAQDPRYGPYCARIELDGKAVGWIGELHPSVRAAYDLPTQAVAVANVAIAPLVSPAWSVHQMRPISPYPPVIEDLAFQMDTGIAAQQVTAAIRAGGGDLLVQAELFDLYVGESLPPGTKSLAYRVTYQSPTTSLSEKAIARIRRRIVHQVERATGAVLRSV